MGNNSLGVAGVSWSVGVHVCKAAHSGGFPFSALLDCYAKCMEQPGVKVVSASYSKLWSGGGGRVGGRGLLCTCFRT